LQIQNCRNIPKQELLESLQAYVEGVFVPWNCRRGQNDENLTFFVDDAEVLFYF
jgi:hypothetical protein